MESLREAIRIAGGQKKLAELCGGNIRQQHVNYWLRVGKVPAEHAIRIERACRERGADISRETLCPDFPWSELAA